MPKSKHTATPVPAEHIVPDSASEMIQYVGVHDLTEEERAAVEEIAAKFHDKIRRKTRHDTNLTLHFKVHGVHKDECHGEEEEPEKRRKFSLHLKVVTPMHIFESEDSDFDIRKLTHEVFDHVLNQVEHKYHENQGVASRLLAPGQSRKTTGRLD